MNCNIMCKPTPPQIFSEKKGKISENLSSDQLSNQAPFKIKSEALQLEPNCSAL
jgi:hypothetical protein